MAYCDALGLPLPAAGASPAGAQYGYVAADALALLAQYPRVARLPAPRAGRWLAGADSAPVHRDDPLPAAFHVARARPSQVLTPVRPAGRESEG